ncbi:MAG: 2'-5' RNA ligase family protein [Bryobacteraceae bacterium]
MDEQGGRGVGINSYALVSYLSGPLARYLDGLREHLSPGCTARAHITVLPPRPITGTAENAWNVLSEQLQDFAPIPVELGGVEVFRQSQVIYLSVKAGHQALEEMHHALNGGPVAFTEPFPYHPHITLAQELLVEAVPAATETAKRLLSECAVPRSFVLDKLTFVQNTLDNRWMDLAAAELTAQRIRRS